MVAQTSGRIHGIAASPGIAVGPVFLYESRKLAVSKRRESNLEAERSRLAAAIEQAKTELRALYERAKVDAGEQEAAIFEAHSMILEDPELLDRVDATLGKESCNAEYAWNDAAEYYASALRQIGDEYLAARAADVEDVAQRVQRILQGVGQENSSPSEPSVITAVDLAPSDTISLEKEKVLAFCTAQGGPTSHVAILSRALGIPAVVGLGDDLQLLTTGRRVIVDGGEGEVIIDPDVATVDEYRRRAVDLKARANVALGSAMQSAVTPDGKRFEIVANIGSPKEASDALEYGAEGVGLLRTEFLFLDRESGPTEDEQYEVYRAVLEVMGQRPVVIRTLDIGGDKPASYLNMPVELNPFLGVRGARMSFAQPEFFQVQLRALLRAGDGHNLKIMAPMVASLEEVHALRAQVDEARTALQERGVTYCKDAEVGIMVEVPSAAVMADLLAPAVDFFSIGTNDLSQYTLAADRTNPNVANLADALHPSVLRLIGMVIRAAHAHGKWVGLCGELAGETLAVPVLLGLGLDEFSMNPRAIPAVKQAIRLYNLEDAEEIAHNTLALATAAEVREYLESVPPQ